MAKFLIEVEEGKTRCEDCIFSEPEICKFAINEIGCNEYDLKTLKITKQE